MIVLPADASLLLITQPDHAALARRVMDAWQSPDLSAHPRRASIMRAIEQHDDGWRDVDASPFVLDGTGWIADFMNAPVDVRQGVWSRGVQVLADDPFAAALVAEHARHIYASHRGDAAWLPFFAEMERLRSDYANVAGVSLAAIERDYSFLRIADLISLVFCNRWTEPRSDFQVTVRWHDGRVVVSPPEAFGGAVVPMSVRAREIANRIFRDTADLQHAIANGREITLSGELASA